MAASRRSLTAGKACAGSTYVKIGFRFWGYGLGFIGDDGKGVCRNRRVLEPAHLHNSLRTGIICTGLNAAATGIVSSLLIWSIVLQTVYTPRLFNLVCFVLLQTVDTKILVLAVGRIAIRSTVIASVIHSDKVPCMSC